MSTESIKNLKETPEITLSKGVDELSAVTALDLNRLVEMENWRISEDGQRIEKRDGVTELVSAATLGAKDVFGYHTYYDTTPAFCQIAVTEEAVWRKVGAAAWASIHTWASTLAHPVKVIDIQGKKIIITEIENIMILPDGTDVQVGITAPITTPTLAAEYLELELDEDCADISDWSDDDAGSGATTQATFDSLSCMKFLTTGAVGDIARRYRSLAAIGSIYTFEIKLQNDLLGLWWDNNYFLGEIYNGRVLFKFRIDKVDLDIYDGTAWKSVRGRERSDESGQPPGHYFDDPEFGSGIGGSYIPGAPSTFIEGGHAGSLLDTWITYKFEVDTSNPENEVVHVYINGVDMGEFPCANTDATNGGKIQLSLYGDTVACISYADYIKLNNSNYKSGNLSGTYRYGVTYRRGGNYPNESNPIKSIVGAAGFNGVGLDDMTSGGTYTGQQDIVVRVQIDGEGTPDTIKWSKDDGVTWVSTLIPVTTTVYLSYGLELTFVATTGHTTDEYWNIVCEALTVSPTSQRVDLTTIPVSTDSQVTQRRIYRTMPGGARYFLVATINDNTTTTYTDNIPNALLGAEMREDNDIAPLGKYAEWWDNRLWIAGSENIIYHSKTLVPDSFDTSRRYVSCRRGKSDDDIMNMIDFNGLFYVFKRDAISFIRRKQTAGYGLYEGPSDFGNIAPWSLLRVHGKLMFLSFRGWEVFNGQEAYSILFSKPIMTTLKTVDKTTLELITAVHVRSQSEVWLSIPDRTGGASAVTCVYNYARGGFYTFTQTKEASFLGEARDSLKAVQVYMGTRDGYVGTCESGTQDFGTSFTATARTGWIKFPIYVNIPMLELEYEAPTDKTFDIYPYVNFQLTVIGSTIGSPAFGGAGLNDLTQSGTYVGEASLNYKIQIDGEGTPDTFKWSDDGGSTWDVETVAITGAAQTLNNGVIVTFAATTGHTSGNYWNIVCTSGVRTLSGATPASTDQDIRLPIKNRLKTAIRGRYFALKFVNDENVGSDVKLNWWKAFYAPMTRKAEIKGD